MLAPDSYRDQAFAPKYQAKLFIGISFKNIRTK
jgi:hypothetical protein